MPVSLAALLSSDVNGEKKRSSGPRATFEFQRVMQLPRRQFTESEEDADVITRWLTKPGAKVRALPLQASAIIECVDNEGGFGVVGVGQGKTLLSILLCEAFYREFGCDRPMILVPSGARENTVHELAKAHVEGWDINVNIPIIGFGELQSPDAGADLLDRLQPNFIFLDEANGFANKSGARSIRLFRYITEKRPYFVPATGTVTRTGPIDYAHMLTAALGDVRAPVPNNWPELMEWHAALAHKPFGPPGVLARFKGPGESLAQGWGRRLRETPGVFHSEGIPTDVGLHVRLCKIETPVIAAAIESIVTDFKAGDEELADHLAQHQAISAACHGHHRRLRWPRGTTRQAINDWYHARREWSVYVREVAKRRRRNLDSEALITRAVDARKIEGGTDLLAAWRQQEKALTPQPEVIWFSDELAGILAPWVAADKRQGIIWTSTIAAGLRLAESLNLPCFGAGQETEIVGYRGVCIASAVAHGVGRNLQHHARMVIIEGRADGVFTQQLIGRLHRKGQNKAVTVNYLIPHGAITDRLDRVVAHAEWLETQTAEKQRLQIAAFENCRGLPVR